MLHILGAYPTQGPRLWCLQASAGVRPSLHAPIDDIMTPLADTLGAMVSSGQLRYDREHNQIALA